MSCNKSTIVALIGTVALYCNDDRQHGMVQYARQLG